MSQSLMFWFAVTLYALSTGCFLVMYAFDRPLPGKIGMLLATIGLAPHVGAIAARWLEVGHGPYNTRYEVLSANVFVMLVISVAALWLIPRLRPVGTIIMPVAFLMMGWGVSTFGLRNEVPIIFKSYWLWLHIGFAKAYAATLVISAGCAVMYLMKSRSIRDQLRDESQDLPRLEMYAYQFLLVSFLLLGVMIIAGSLWAHQSWGRYWAWDPIETCSLVSWLTTGAILHLKSLHAWSGRRMAWLYLAALVCGVVTLYVVTLVVPTIHNSYMVGK
jgi:ABC-type transport system involved in cytochrome c biogenesis permease subunit